MVFQGTTSTGEYTAWKRPSSKGVFIQCGRDHGIPGYNKQRCEPIYIQLIRTMVFPGTTSTAVYIQRGRVHGMYSRVQQVQVNILRGRDHQVKVCLYSVRGTMVFQVTTSKGVYTVWKGPWYS